MRKAILAPVALLAACASQPEEIQTAYVSPIQYQDYNCKQLSGELARVTRRASDLKGQLRKTADDDEVQMGVGLILLWPTLFFLEGGDGPQAQEYARLKGERDAIEITSIQKECGLKIVPIKAPPRKDMTNSDDKT